MKIGVLISSLNTGGAERTAVALANWLAKNTKDEIYLINLGKDDHNYQIDCQVITYHKKSSSGLFQKIRNTLDVIKYLNEIKLDVAFEMLFSPVKYLMVHKLFHRKFVMIGSERNNPRERYKTLKLKFLSKICPKLCDGYIFQTKTVKEMFSSKVQEKSTVISNAISNPLVFQVTLPKKREKKIVSVGRLDYQKGYDTLIKSFKIVNQKYPEYQLVIYGEDTERSKLEQLIQDLALEKSVLLPGKCKNVIEKVSKAEIFIMTSRYEGMPNALMEAMAIGMPCISTNCIAGPSEIIQNNKNGILVEVDNINQIANKILYLIENPKVREDFGEQAKRIRNQYSPDTVYKKYYNYFQEVYYSKTKGMK